MARMCARRFLLPWAASLAVVCCFGSAAAAPKKKAPPPPPSAAPGTVAPSGPVAKTGISSVLNFLDWGATSGQVMDSLKQEIEARWADTLKELRDPMEIDRALRRKATEFAAVEKTYVRFSGERQRLGQRGRQVHHFGARCAQACHGQLDRLEFGVGLGHFILQGGRDEDEGKRKASQPKRDQPEHNGLPQCRQAL